MALKNKLPERYPDIIAMYAKGHVNSLDLLRTDFGHWPPNGLDIVRPPNIDIKFRSMFGTVYGLSRFIPSLTSIYLISTFFKSYPISTVIFTALTTAARVMSLGGFVKQGESTIFLNDMYRAFGQTQGGRRYLSHIISHEFKHVVQGRDREESMSSAFDGDRLEIKGMLIEDASKHQKYLAEEYEIQARLHTLMVGAYHQFEKMPTSYAELIAVLYSQGMYLPKVVVREVRETEEGKKAFSFFKTDKDLLDRYADKDAIKYLSEVIKAVSPWKRKMFCQDVLSFIYGDMLELYGDRLGHKRMGHTHNIQLREVFYKSAKNYEADKRVLSEKLIVEPAEIETMENYFKEAVAVVGKMEKEDAVDLGCNILRGDIYFEYGGAACVTYKKNGVGEATIKEIWARSDITAKDKRLMRLAAQEFPSEYDVGVSEKSLKPQGRGGIATFEVAA